MMMFRFQNRFELLRADGVAPQQAATYAQKYGSQLQELQAMGFSKWARAVELLDKYQGRMVRVVNALAEEM